MITGELLTEGENCDDIYIDYLHYPVRQVENVLVLGPISSFLTKEELTKAANNNLTDNEVIDIVSRITTTQDAKQKIKK